MPSVRRRRHKRTIPYARRNGLSVASGMDRGSDAVMFKGDPYGMPAPGTNRRIDPPVEIDVDLGKRTLLDQIKRAYESANPDWARFLELRYQQKYQEEPPGGITPATVFDQKTKNTSIDKNIEANLTRQRDQRELMLIAQKAAADEAAAAHAITEAQLQGPERKMVEAKRKWWERAVQREKPQPGRSDWQPSTPFVYGRYGRPPPPGFVHPELLVESDRKHHEPAYSGPMNPDIVRRWRNRNRRTANRQAKREGFLYEKSLEARHEAEETAQDDDRKRYNYGTDEGHTAREEEDEQDVFHTARSHVSTGEEKFFPVFETPSKKVVNGIVIPSLPLPPTLPKLERPRSRMNEYKFGTNLYDTKVGRESGEPYTFIVHPAQTRDWSSMQDDEFRGQRLVENGGKTPPGETYVSPTRLRRFSNPNTTTTPFQPGLLTPITNPFQDSPFLPKTESKRLEKEIKDPKTPFVDSQAEAMERLRKEREIQNKDEATLRQAVLDAHSQGLVPVVTAAGVVNAGPPPKPKKQEVNRSPYETRSKSKKNKNKPKQRWK